MNNVRKYTVKLTGQSPMLMHKDNIQWGERVRAWTKDPANKGVSVAGDDRSPAWTWLGYLYHDGKVLAVDADCIMSMLRAGGTKCPAPTGRGSMKVQTQSGILCNELFWPLENNGATVPFAPLVALADEDDFDKHVATVEGMGFDLLVKRAKIGQAKHIRVRARFDNWSASGTLTVMEATITTDMLKTILNYAGVYAGLCDWRPGSPKSPGQFGKFTAEVEEM
jgi:hypothetical protein